MYVLTQKAAGNVPDVWYGAPLRATGRLAREDLKMQHSNGVSYQPRRMP